MESQIREDLRVIRDKVESIDKNVALNTQSLDHHIARTEAAETRILYLERIFIGLGVLAVGGLIAALVKLLIE